MKKIISSVLMLILCAPCFAKASLGNTNMAGVTISSIETNKEKREVVQELYKWLNKIGQHEEVLTRQGVENFFDENVKYSVNGKLLTKNTRELVDRFEILMTINKSIKILMPLEHVVVSDNKVAVTYKINLSNDKDYTDQITSLITFSGDKIVSWESVAQHL